MHPSAGQPHRCAALKAIGGLQTRWFLCARAPTFCSCVCSPVSLTPDESAAQAAAGSSHAHAANRARTPICRQLRCGSTCKQHTSTCDKQWRAPQRLQALTACRHSPGGVRLCIAPNSSSPPCGGCRRPSGRAAVSRSQAQRPATPPHYPTATAAAVSLRGTCCTEVRGAPHALLQACIHVCQCECLRTGAAPRLAAAAAGCLSSPRT